MEIDDPIQFNTDSTTDICYFSLQDISKIHWVIKYTQIPPWLNWPSPIFGDAAAGKVHSADWITFFAIFMPFAIVELGWTNKSELVDSWYHLAMLTEIAMDYTTDQQKTPQYLFHLTSYRSNIAQFYPNLTAKIFVSDGPIRCSITPRYAMQCQ
ncbi:hypothetical protein CROQUDRAFT_52901 [Cronartium quercuum f. sp. fusiforme G11]|uniref:Uncharacterized protein n=1 Tax=Cronartium quercuum f. sp. fusiforme G11 TaxID=708437 RepID=A0A9P6NBF3_9BASI|nr:hypothetical protein CROQUDRAFT_52901 [Cronartium quercuum f. sp. fusiforme G11]